VVSYERSDWTIRAKADLLDEGVVDTKVGDRVRGEGAAG
jgi:hypothetical protein